MFRLHISDGDHECIIKLQMLITTDKVFFFPSRSSALNFSI